MSSSPPNKIFRDTCFPESQGWPLLGIRSALSETSSEARPRGRNVLEQRVLNGDKGLGKERTGKFLALENASDRLTSHTATQRDDRKDMSLRENSQVDIR